MDGNDSTRAQDVTPLTDEQLEQILGGYDLITPISVAPARPGIWNYYQPVFRNLQDN